MRKFIERNVAVIESNYQLVSNNLSHCRKSLKTLEGLLRKISAVLTMRFIHTYMHTCTYLLTYIHTYILTCKNT